MLNFICHPLPGSNDLLNDRIREVAEKVNNYGGPPQPALAGLKVPIKQVVLGPSHIGILTEDGRAYRCQFSIIPERLDLSKNEPAKNLSGGSNLTTNSSSNAKSSQTTSRQLSRSRARIIRTGSVRGGSGSRSTGVIIGGTSAGGRSMVTVPAPLVPEELISQAQVVLQGKSRNVIIRELQRTNLDVNLAVNNLLSRDDEEGEDTEENSENYVPEDLISLLDNGFHTDNSIIIDADASFSEDIFGYSNIRNRVRSERGNTNSGSGGGAAGAVSSGTASGQEISGNRTLVTSGSSQTAGTTSSGTAALVAAAAAASGSSAGTASGQISGGSNNLGGIPNAPPPPVSSDRDSFSRWRDRQYFGPRRWFQSAREEANWEKESDVIKKELSSGIPLWISEELEAWPEKDVPVRFVEIASLHSEFIGVTLKGELHQWKWSEMDAYRSAENTNVFHPKTIPLNLVSEKVIHISATSIRCTVATESNRIATWMDELLGHAGLKLEHSAITLPDLSMDKIQSLHTCSLYSVARTENGGIFWWGVLPYSQRKKLWDKYKAKSRKPVRSSGSIAAGTADVTVGAQVCMKNSPMYMPGAIGFTVSNGVPKVGQLLNHAWDFTDMCRFKIVSVTPPPSATVPTSSATSSTPADHKESAAGGKLGNSNSNSSLSGLTSGKTTPNKETADRLDMPPPPSPASSTCSDTASGSSHKRQKRMAPREDAEKKDEECWILKDVVFVEDVKTVPLGRVVKIDGAFAAVELTNSSTGGDSKEEKDDIWTNCRLLKKEDLQVMKSTSSSRGPDCFQKMPRRIVLSLQQPGTSFQLLTLAVDAKGVHTIVKHSGKIHYAMFNLNSGRQEQDSVFPSDVNAFMGIQPRQISLTCAADTSTESVLLLRDGNSAIYPLAKDCMNAIKDPQLLDFPQVRCIATITLSLPTLESNLKSQLAVVVMAPERQMLMGRILRCDYKAVKGFLTQLDIGDATTTRNQVLGILNERCDGNRNIFHACISMCAPTSNKDNDNDVNMNPDMVNMVIPINNAAYASTRPVSIRDMVRRAPHAAMRDSEGANNASASLNEEQHQNFMSVSYWDTDYNPYSGDEESMMGLSTSGSMKQHLQKTPMVFVSDAVERRENALPSLVAMCSSKALHPYLVQLLSGKDGQGQTPFMLAVAMRAYQAAKIVFDVIIEISNGDAEVRDSMVFPAGSNADQSPLYMLCCNDTCSFTWTGAVHINQDIFECRTCGLVGTLCCCTECAKVCHKGHDCKLKRTSPTAYCDCCEKCKCKALIAGNQKKRFELFSKLASDTDLVTRYNSRGESILLFLIQTVGRQLAEQSQCNISTRSRNVAARKTPSLDPDAEVGEHNLEPPRFAKKAIGRLLQDWAAVKSMIMTGVADKSSPTTSTADEAEPTSLYFQGQSGTTLLDKFTHSLITCCSHEPLDTLLATFVRELQNDQVEGRMDEAQNVARRFIRSAARVYVIFSIERIPVQDKQKQSSSPQLRNMNTCRRIFMNLAKVSIEELCETADALIAPVRMGVVRPTAPFGLATNNSDNSEDVFSVEPLAPVTTTRRSTATNFGQASTSGEPMPRFMSQLNVRMRDIVNEAADGGNQDDEEISEQDDVLDRDNRSNLRQSRDEGESEAGAGGSGNNNDETHDNMRIEEAAEGESDPEFNFQEAETESDSDDNQSTQDAQRSVQTGATAGSDTGTVHNLFLDDDDEHHNHDDDDDDDNDNHHDHDLNEDETNDSSQPDEDGSEDGETDEHSQEDFTYTLGEEQLERRTASAGNQRHNLAPQAMQWAIRSRDSGRASGVRLTTSGSNLVFIDSAALRRSTTTGGTQDYHPSGAPAISLARAFACVIRVVSDLLNSSYESSLQVNGNQGGAAASISISYQEVVQLQKRVEEKLKPTWDWVLSVMDATEAQLKFGASLTNSADPANPLHPLHHPAGASAINVGGISDAQPSRREFLTYCLSLMRAHSSEHRDSLPVLDVTSLRHIAYVLDAIIFYMRSASEQDYNGVGSTDKESSIAWNDQDEHDHDENDDELTGIGMESESIDDDEMFSTAAGGRRNGFFQRSESTLCLGCSAPDPFALPMAEALPLANEPHLLTPHTKREELFYMPKPQISLKASSNNPLSDPPKRLGLSSTFKPIDAVKETSALTAEAKKHVTVIKEVTTTLDADEPMDVEVAGSSGTTTNTESNKTPQKEQQPSSSGASKEGYVKPYLYIKKREFYNQYHDPKKQPDQPQDLSLCSKAAAVDPQSDDSDNDDDSSDVEMEGSDYGENIVATRPVAKTANVRPHVIVTPRKVASAIESATAAVLAKTNKASLEDCVPQEGVVSIAYLPLCVFDGQQQPATSAVEKNPEGDESNKGDGGSTTVIVRAGCSTSGDPTAMDVGQSVDTILDTQEISANVTVETTPNVVQSQELPPRGLHLCSFRCIEPITSDLLLGRWRQSLDLFSRVFMEDVGIEPGSIICELGGFSVKEARFRRNMEKLRSGQQRDLILSKLERGRAGLLFQTFKELNTQFGSQTRRAHPPLSFNRVKVTFLNEPGEGSGVARSFYTSIAEALLSDEKLPNLEGAQVGKYAVPFGNLLRQRTGGSSSGSGAGASVVSVGRDVGPFSHRRVFSNKSLWRPNRDSRKNATFESRLSSLMASSGNNSSSSSNNNGSGSTAGNNNGGPGNVIVGGVPAAATNNSSGGSTANVANAGVQGGASGVTAASNSVAGTSAVASQASASGNSIPGAGGASGQLEQRFYQKVYSLHPSSHAGKSTDNVGSVESTVPIGTGSGTSPSAAGSDSNYGQNNKKMNPIVLLDDTQLDDSAPLFYSPGKRGFYSPRQGFASFERVNAYRNIGRLMGLCLLQNELFPLYLQRHVFKFILGRQVRFHDLAFFDPVIYESMRILIKDTQSKSGTTDLQSYEIYFIIDLSAEEGGGSVELIPGGRDILVNESNVYDYVRKYAEYRMIRCQEKALEALRQGVFDVLPEYALDRLTAEDLRLLLNGVGDIHVGTLISYTTFNDESNEKSDKLTKLKRWLWSTVEKMQNSEKQDLLNFWTGSPALPASEEGFQPMPTVNIRPADDAHLPTANTCISRLYIPLYSSKAILRHKLLLAIKAKNFGFV